jgi:hypothetical protein
MFNDVVCVCKWDTSVCRYRPALLSNHDHEPRFKFRRGGLGNAWALITTKAYVFVHLSSVVDARHTAFELKPHRITHAWPCGKALAHYCLPKHQGMHDPWVAPRNGATRSISSFKLAAYLPSLDMEIAQ